MRPEEDGVDQRTLWCGNISDQVSDEVLYELFLQAGPLESIKRPRDQNGVPRSFAFIVYKHECSVPYAAELFRGEKLFNRELKLQSHSRLQHTPVLDTHLSEFTEHLADNSGHRKEGRDRRNDKRHSGKDRDGNEATSWAELRGRGSLLNGLSTFKRNDLLGAQVSIKETKSQDSPGSKFDFESLLKMGSQMMPNMMHPGMLPFGGLPFAAGGSMGPMNLMDPMGAMVHNVYPSMQGGVSGGKRFSPEKGHNMYPSMQGVMSGGKRFSPETERRNDRYEGRGSRRDHPYQDKRQGGHYDNRRHSDNNFNHRRHDRGYSSSRSSHERERRDRRSR